MDALSAAAFGVVLAALTYCIRKKIGLTQSYQSQQSFFVPFPRCSL